MKLQTGARVVLLAQEGREIPCKVDLVTDEAVHVVPLTVVGDGLGGGTSPVFLEWTDRTGMHRVRGNVETGGSVRGVLTVARDGGRETLQRRSLVRAQTTLDVALLLRSERGAPRRARTSTLDVSGGGAMIIDPVGLDVGSVVEAEFSLDPGSRPVRVEATVVRCSARGPDGRPAIGLRFDRIEELDRERVIRYVFERERAALRVAAGT